MAGVNFKVLPVTLCLLAMANIHLTDPINQISPKTGDHFSVACLVGHVKDYSVSWVKINKENNISEVLTAGSSVITKDPRVSLEVNSTSHIYTLVIKDLQESHTGIYQCEIINAGTLNDTQKLELRIQKPPLRWVNSTSSAVVQEGGDSVQQTPSPTTTLYEYPHNETHRQLDCIRGHALDYSVSWIRFDEEANTTEILTSGPSLITKDPRFSLDADFAMDTHKINYKLFIKDYKENDARSGYQCHTLRYAPIFGVPVKAKQAGQANSQQTVSINHISPENHVTGYIGDDVQLLCTVEHVQNYSVTWVKINKESNISEALTAGSSLITKDPRFSLDVDSRLNTSIHKLLIKDLQEPDAGFYQCQVILAGTHRINKELELRLQKPPLSLANSTSSAVVQEGENNVQQTPSITTIPPEQHPILHNRTDIQLNCTLEHALDYSVAWARIIKESDLSETLTVGPSLIADDPRFSLETYLATDTHKNNYNLLIKDFQEADEGFIYECRKSVTSLHSFTKTMLTPENLVGTLTGNDAEYTCRVQYINNTDPVTWVKINKESNISETLTSGSSVITKDPRISLEVDSTLNTNIYTHKLRIKNLQKPDEGIYQCQVFSSGSLWIVETLELKVDTSPVHHATWELKLTLIIDTDQLPEFW